MNAILTKIKEAVINNKGRILCSFFSTLIMGFIFNILFSIFFGCVASLAQESYININNNSEDLKNINLDMIYNVLGIIIAVIILLLV